MHYRTSLLWLGLSASLISASPVRELISETDINLLRRNENVVKTLKNALPSCDDDPAKSKDRSRWQTIEEQDKQEGLQFVTTCRNKKGHRKSPCWYISPHRLLSLSTNISTRTDFFIVDWEYEYGPWKNTGQEIDCQGTSNCNHQGTDLNQVCEANTKSKTSKVQGAFNAKFDAIKDLLSLGAEIQVGGEKSNADTFTTCTTGSQSVRCTWDDGKCHAFWAATRYRRFYGYARRLCDTNRKSRWLFQII